MTSLELEDKSKSEILYSELELLNFAISLCMETSNYGIENIMHQIGYRIISVERSINTTVGTLKYDLCLSCRSKEMTIGFEIKGGLASNISMDQLKRYDGVGVKEFIIESGIPFNDGTIHQLSTVIMCNTSRAGILRQELEVNGYNFSIFSLDASHFQVFIDPKGIIDDEFIETVQNDVKVINHKRIPYYIKFDKESLLSDIAKSVITEYVRFILEKRTSFKVDEMIENVYCSVPGLVKIIGADVKKHISRTIKSILRQMSKKEFVKYLEWDGQKQAWQINNINETNNLQILKVLKTRGESFLLGIEGKKAEDLVPEGQLSFEDFEVMYE